MTIQTIVVSDFVTGLENDVVPTKISNEAFSVLENAYVWRNRVKQKDGVASLGRLKRELTAQSLGNTDGAGNKSVNIISTVSLELTSSIVPGSITVTVAGAPPQVFTEPAIPDGTLSNGGLGTGTINYATGALTLDTNPDLAAAAVTITFEYYPGLPVLGLDNYDTQAINTETLIAFDQKYAYEYFTNEFIDASFYKMAAPRNPVTWSGGNYQQFYATNYEGAMWVTNNNHGTHILSITDITKNNPGVVTTAVNHGLSTGDKIIILNVVGMTQVNSTTSTVTQFTITVTALNKFTIGVNTTAYGAYVSGGLAMILSSTVSGDGIRWYDGNSSTLGFANFNPPLNSANTQFLKGALCMIPFKDRLLFFNTVEGTSSTSNNIRYPQRCRWSENGTPYYANSPTNYGVQLAAFYDDIPGRGGYIDCPTNEHITAIAQNKDVVLVWFERSFYRIVYTGNEVLPFIWQKINDTLGVESAFSPVQFDDYAMGFGMTGIFKSTTNDIARIDTRIPNIIFTVKNSDNGQERVCGLIDYDEEVVYFAYPDAIAPVDTSFVYNTRILLYNYRNDTFGTLKDTFTTLGYFYTTTDLSLKWGNASDEWGDANYEWGTYQYNTAHRIVAAGNQKGYVFRLIHQQVVNDPQLNIEAYNITTGQITCANHGLEDGDFVYITDCLGSTALNDITYQIQLINNNNFRLLDFPAASAYTGLGQLARVDKFQIGTKEFNMFTKVPISMRINQVDFYVETTESGQFVCQIYEGTNINQAVNSSSLIGGTGYSMGADSDIVVSTPNNLLIQIPQQEYLWQTLQPSVTGQSMRLFMTQDERQLLDRDIYQHQLIMQAFVVYFTSSGRLIQ
jgi:hypothetical protein